jgi:hypothetical protein
VLLPGRWYVSQWDIAKNAELAGECDLTEISRGNYICSKCFQTYTD